MKKQMWRPLFNRLIVFTVPVRRKSDTSGLYLGHRSRDTYSSCQEAWVVAPGPECRAPFAPGMRVFVHDAFELEPTDLNLWPELEAEPEFESLRRLVHECEGDVITQIVSELSILAFDE
jgi:hypothetical protein